MKTTMNNEAKKMIAGRRVFDVLRENAKSRDDDSVLYVEVLKKYGCSTNMRATTLEKRVSEGVLPSRDTVTRYRRYFQNVDETLRGNLWNKRQAYASVVRKTI